MCKCADNIKPKRTASPMLQSFAAQSVPDEPMVRIEYQGNGGATVSVYGKATGQGYGRRKAGDTFLIYESDQGAQPGLFKAVT